MSAYYMQLNVTLKKHLYVNHIYIVSAVNQPYKDDFYTVSHSMYEFMFHYVIRVKPLGYM